MTDTLSVFYVQAAGFAVKAAAALAILAGFWIGSRVLRNLIRGLSRRQRLNTTIIQLLAKTVEVAMMIFGVITALGTLGVNIGAMVAGLGLSGFALGLALKDVLSNVLAGVMILLYRPFRIGQRIAITGIGEGRVIDVDLRYTTLHADERRILIPNSSVLNNSVTINEAAEVPAAGARLGS